MPLNIRHGIKTAGTSWPDSSTTGPSGALTAVPGSATSGTGWTWDSVDKIVVPTGAGVTIQNLDVTGCIYVEGLANVTVSNCKCNYVVGVNAGIFGVSSNSMTVTDCEVNGPGMSFTTGYSGIRNDSGTGFHVQRCEVYGAENGMFLGGTNMIIEDNYIHDLVPEDIFGDPNGANAPHTDGIQLAGGNECNGSILRHNNIISSPSGKTTSGIITGSGQNTTITNNRILYGTYTLYIWMDSTNVYTNNRIYGGFSGLITDTGGTGSPTISGNVNDQTGAAITYP